MILFKYLIQFRRETLHSTYPNVLSFLLFSPWAEWSNTMPCFLRDGLERFQSFNFNFYLVIYDHCHLYCFFFPQPSLHYSVFLQILRHTQICGTSHFCQLINTGFILLPLYCSIRGILGTVGCTERKRSGFAICLKLAQISQLWEKYGTLQAYEIIFFKMISRLKLSKETIHGRGKIIISE